MAAEEPNFRCFILHLAPWRISCIRSGLRCRLHPSFRLQPLGIVRPRHIGFLLQVGHVRHQVTEPFLAESFHVKSVGLFEALPRFPHRALYGADVIVEGHLVQFKKSFPD